MSRLEKKWFGYYKPNPSTTQTPQRMSVGDFLGLLLITIPITVLTFVGFIVSKCRETNLNRSDVQKTGRVGNGGSHAGTVGSDQTKPTDNSPQMANAQINLGNTGVASSGYVDPSVDSTCSSAEEVDTPPNSLDIGRGMNSVGHFSVTLVAHRCLHL